MTLVSQHLKVTALWKRKQTTIQLSVSRMDEKKAKRPQGLSLGLGLVFGAVMYVLTNEAFWIPVGIALGAAREMRAQK